MNEFEDLLNTSYADLLKKENKSCNFVINLPILRDGRLIGDEVLVDGRIDDESKKMLDTFNLLLKEAFRPSMSGSLDRSINYTKNSTQYDFSALINSLSKVFEREMNNSIIQKIRFEKGIEMPEYYNKVKPGIVLQWDDEELNKSRDGSLATLEIGKLLLRLRNDPALSSSEIKKLYDNHEKFLNKLRKNRNATSHTEVVDENFFTDFYEGYCTLVSDGWFTELMKIKDEMKGR